MSLICLRSKETLEMQSICINTADIAHSCLLCNLCEQEILYNRTFILKL